MECLFDDCGRLQACQGLPVRVTRISMPSARTAFRLRKQPLQRRAAATVDAILEGTAQILERGNPLTTNTVAERAGVSIGTLYQYFDAKEVVVAELSRKARSELVRSVAAAIDQVRLLPLVRGLPVVLGAALEMEMRRPRLALALDRLEHDLRLLPDDALISSCLSDLVSDWLHQQRPECEPQALRMLAEDLNSVVGALTGASLSRGEGIDDQFITRTSETLIAIIESRLESGERRTSMR